MNLNLYQEITDVSLLNTLGISLITIILTKIKNLFKSAEEENIQEGADNSNITFSIFLKYIAIFLLVFVSISFGLHAINQLYLIADSHGNYISNLENITLIAKVKTLFSIESIQKIIKNDGGLYLTTIFVSISSIVYLTAKAQEDSYLPVIICSL